MAKRKRGIKRPKKLLDTPSRGKRRGRRGVLRSEIINRAYHYGLLLQHWWDVLGQPMLRAKTADEVIHAFNGIPPYAKNQFVPALAPLILKVLREPKFPKTRNAQIRFLADSLAGLGRVSPRRSRDICAEGRAKPPHYIIRQDFYIGCTCGYEGPALRGACPKCGTDNVALREIIRGALHE